MARHYEDDAGNPVPSVAVEMEVRFSGSPDRVLAALGKSVTPRSVDDVVSGLSWTGLLSLARQLTGYAVVERWFIEKGVFNVNLNGYVNLRMLVGQRCAIYDNAIEAIRRYDRAVVRLMEEMCWRRRVVGPRGFEPRTTGSQAPHPSQARRRPHLAPGAGFEPARPSSGQRVSRAAANPWLCHLEPAALGRSATPAPRLSSTPLHGALLSFGAPGAMLRGC